MIYKTAIFPVCTRYFFVKKTTTAMFYHNEFMNWSCKWKLFIMANLWLIGHTLVIHCNAKTHRTYYGSWLVASSASTASGLGGLTRWGHLSGKVCETLLLQLLGYLLSKSLCTISPALSYSCNKITMTWIQISRQKLAIRS